MISSIVMIIQKFISSYLLNYITGVTIHKTTALAVTSTNVLLMAGAAHKVAPTLTADILALVPTIFIKFEMGKYINNTF